MAKWVIFTDFHSHDFKSYNKGPISRLDIGLEILKKIYAHADKIGAAGILFGGDWFDSPKLLPTIVVNRNTEVILQLSKEYPQLACLAISGNHDQSSKNLLHKPAVTALTYLEEIAPNNFKIIDDKTFTLGDLCISGIPYYEFKEDYHQRLKERHDKIMDKPRPGVYKVLLIHQTPSGMGNPNIPVDTDVNDPLYDAWDDVFCGHIHSRIEITPKFTLVGNTHHRDLGDAGSEKGFYVIDTESKSKEFVSLKGQYPEYIRQRVKIGESVTDDGYNYYVPHYITGDADVENNPEGLINTENFEVDLSPDKLIENYCKEVAPGDEELLKVGLECLKLKIEE